LDSLWWCYGVTKDPTKNDLLLVYSYDNLSVETIEIIKTTIETLKTIEDCGNCKDKEVGRNSFDEFHKLINEIVTVTKYDLVENLFKTNIRLNNEVLCEGCKRKEIRKGLKVEKNLLKKPKKYTYIICLIPAITY
jgi:hypothetical protein